MNAATAGRWRNCAASSVMTTSASGIQEIKKAVCEKVLRSSVTGTSVGDGGNGAPSSCVMTSASGTARDQARCG